ncbi:DUF5345 family protein [Desnuesiella massiliensis]|uniref:DUF5345 family protein n=1 Tax=Desnuesiella massiliensis TaxID=1650662 RepID=UPI0006E3CCAF|nr:DUF5345 family protein [Desnuesiella massiliensis]
MIEEKREKDLVDYYYNEKKKIELKYEDKIFLDNLEALSSKMNALDDELQKISLDVDLSSIIEKAEHKNRKRNFIEVFGFVSISSILITSIVFLILKSNPSMFLYLQVVLSMLLSFSLIPFAYFNKKKEELN